MNSTVCREKSISLTYRGFDLSAEEVASLVGVAASKLGNKGELVKPTVKTRLTRSYVRFSMSYPNDYPLSDMLPPLFTHLGGIAHLCHIKNQIQPEFFEIDCHLPARQAEEIQDGYLSTTVIADVCKLGATLGFGFF